MRRRRKYVVTALGAALALTTVGIAFAAQGDVIQTMTSDVSKATKLKKDDFTNRKETIVVSGCYEGTTPGECDPEAVPPGPDTSEVVFQFDKKDVKINPKARPTCKSSREELATLSPEQAKAACEGSASGRQAKAAGSSQVGAGDAVAAVGSAKLNATVTAFNAPQKHVWLHSWVDDAQTGVVVDAALKPGNKFNVTVDPLLGGNARLQEFEVTFNAGEWFQARCTDKQIKTSSNWTYRSGEPNEKVDYVQKCKGK